MSKAELDGPILKSVSRSFYLSVRVLPAPLRAPVGLAYLLARASDTIADTATLPIETRVAHLAAYGRMVATGSVDGLRELQQEIVPPHHGEQQLIARLPECFDWLAAVPSADRDEIRRVLAKIIHGQTLDLKRFPLSESGQVTALQTAEELEEYTYLVAGCVGEFWTRISFLHLPSYSKMPPDDLAAIGRDLGKALQLVNILRDLPFDLREGRCYLPETELREDGIALTDLPSDPSPAQSVFDRWLVRAEELAESGAKYVRAIRPARVRIACFLPWDLANKTLALMRQEPPLRSGSRIKVSRKSVYASLGRAMFAGGSDHSVR